MKRFALIPTILLYLLLATCGKNSVKPNYTNLFGITFASIPGGTFQMGDVENAGGSIEKPVHTVTLSGFEMSTTEVTNAQYCAYLNAAKASGDIEVRNDGKVYGKTGKWKNQGYLDIGFAYDENNRCCIAVSSGQFSVTQGHENWPVVAVTWYGAKAFALYCGLDLPTEAEWEYACRGGKQSKYGTDDGTISGTKANYFQNGPGHPVVVGSYPANPYGLYDMSGNVWEWCNDWYGNYLSVSANNPTGEKTGSLRVSCGGGWSGNDCRSACRTANTPYYMDDVLGFRVVRRPGGLTY